MRNNKPTPEPIRQKILKKVRNGSKQLEIAEELNVRKELVSKIVNRAKKNGELRLAIPPRGLGYKGA